MTGVYLQSVALQINCSIISTAKPAAHGLAPMVRSQKALAFGGDKKGSPVPPATQWVPRQTRQSPGTSVDKKHNV